MARGPADLESYIYRAYSKAGIKPDPKEPRYEIFTVRYPHHAPVLPRNCVNRILIYDGKFSPPHYVDLSFLERSFPHAGADLNLVAAVVWPRGEIFDERDNVQLTREERAQLWMGAEEYKSHYYWLFRSRPRNGRPFRRRSRTRSL
jgi:hypothetical protein